MSKRASQVFAFLLIVLALTLPRGAWAQKTESSKQPTTAPSDELSAEEEPPPPEAPYPGARPSDEPPPVKMPMSAKPRKAESHPESQPEPPNERPKKINEDGDYVYDTKITAPTFSGRTGIAAPKSSTTSGEYLYDPAETPESFSGRPGVEAPILTTPTGEYRYTTETHVANRSASFHVGVITPPNITNPDNNLTFADIYGGGPAPILFGDYEFYRLNTKVGRIGLKFGSGIFVASGPGQWKIPRPAGSELPYETENFAMFPNTLTALYKFQYSDNQWFVPYIEGGPGYFTFVEVRSDAKLIRGGGSPTIVGVGGLNFLMNNLDPRAIREMDLEYGINHLWLSLEARGILGLESNVNFTSIAFSLGFLMEF